jgi:hypothetical protein
MAVSGVGGGSWDILRTLDISHPTEGIIISSFIFLTADRVSSAQTEIENFTSFMSTSVMSQTPFA